MNQWDTIAAIATALGEGSVSIIRVSGDEAISVVDSIFVGSVKITAMASHSVQYGHIHDRVTGQAIDEVLVLLMRGPRSYTREDVVEIHSHGGIMAVQAVLRAVLRSGARLAEPGEFTKRAFLNGRIDLSQAEAIIDVIRSKTDSAMKIAMKQVEGSLSQQIRGLRQQMVEMMAHIEVTIDYPEHDVEDVTIRHIVDEAGRAVGHIDQLLRMASTGRMFREGIRTVIVGRPNVGKSSLLNALSRTNRAIVTDIPGTTRDILEEQISLRGIPLHIIDTAGIRHTQDVVEKIGVERSWSALEEAHLVLFMIDSSTELTDTEQELAHLLQGRPTIVVLNKMDLPQVTHEEDLRRLLPECRIVRLSVLQEKGLSDLEDSVQELFLGGEIAAEEATYVSNARHISLLEQARKELQEAINSAEQGMTLDLVAVDIRNAWESLGEVIGEAVGEDLLDQIFSQFCLGK